jgi:DNA-directed RNA polymerase subunit M/transcription elongation factor TFIIS
MDNPSDPKIQEAVIREQLEIPANLKLRLEKCPRCSYERQPGDDRLATPFECPKCGVVYAVAMEDVRRKNRGQELQDEAEVDELRRQSGAQGDAVHSSQVGSAMFVSEERGKIWLVAVLVLGAVALAAYFMM